MRARHSSLYAVLALALGTSGATAQTAPTTPSGSVSAGTSAGAPPTAPAVQVPPTPANSTDAAGQQQGFFAPSTTDTVVVPAFTPTTPGVTPIDTPTNATVGSSASDRALRDSVASAITSDPSLQGARINVTVNNGVVTLSGSAKDGTQASRARAVAEGVAGTARVNASISTSG